LTITGLDIVEVTSEMSYLPFEHTFHILELDAVLELIATRCINEGARELVRSSTPSKDNKWIAVALKEIENMRMYLTVENDIPIATTDSEAAMERAGKTNELIPGRDLLAIARVESTALDIQRRFRDKDETYPHLCRLVDQFIPDKTLVDIISRALNRDAEIKDDASDELASIRKRIRNSREGLRVHAERQAKQYGDNAYPTLLDGRFAILVPRDQLRRRDGIVHSKSHSGGSMYFEPLSLVEKNNEFETLLLDETAEIKRILHSLTLAVVRGIDDLRIDFDTMNRIDALRAKARFSKTYDCITPGLSQTRGIRLLKARHPLLELSLKENDSEREVIPLNIEIKEDEPVLVITGPNAGGKTVAIKTLGVVVLMHQLGLQVPAATGTELRIFERVFTDIGDEQSIASSLSTFTSHLRHLDAMCRLSTGESLCLIDEIGDGTDPDEGAALANATLENLLAKRVVTVATTHYGKVKTFALRMAGVSNASMVFDDVTQEPLYGVVSMKRLSSVQKPSLGKKRSNSKPYWASSRRATLLSRRSGSSSSPNRKN
jgi:DNA mismatch repair protein MutS2